MLNLDLITAGFNFNELKPLRLCKSDENLHSQCGSHNPSSSSHIGGIKSDDHKTLNNPITINLTKTFKKEDDLTQLHPQNFSFSPQPQKSFSCSIRPTQKNSSNSSYIYNRDNQDLPLTPHPKTPPHPPIPTLDPHPKTQSPCPPPFTPHIKPPKSNKVYLPTQTPQPQPSTLQRPYQRAQFTLYIPKSCISLQICTKTT